MLNEGEIEIKRTKDGFKAKLPLIPEEDIRIINNEFDSIVDKFSKMIIRDKDLAIAQYIVKKQNKVIDEMAEQLSGLTILDIKKDEYIDLGDKEEVKEYFKKKVEEK